MNRPLAIRRARVDELPVVLRLLAASAAWMNDHRGSCAWPRDGFPAERIQPDLFQGTVWLALDQDTPVATLTLDTRPDTEFTAPEAQQAGVADRAGEAMILHRMAVDRSPTYAGNGIGEQLLDWAAGRTYWACRSWLWVNCARTADRLQRWYARNGFTHMVTVTSTGRRSGSLWQRPAEPWSPEHTETPGIW